MKHNTTQHNTTQHNTTQHNATQHNTTQHNTTQHNTTLLLVFFCGLLGMNGLNAQTSLFSEVSLSSWTLDSSQQKVINYVNARPYKEGNARYYEGASLLDIQNNGLLSLTLPGFESTALDFWAEQIEFDSANSYTWYGRTPDGSGEIFFFQKPEGRMGFIDLGDRFYSIHPLGGNKNTIIKHNLTAPLSNSGCDTEDIKGVASAEAFCEKEDCGAATVDVLALITPGAQTFLNNNFGIFGGFYLFVGFGSINGILGLSGVPNKRVRTRTLAFTPTDPLSIDLDADMQNLENDPAVQDFAYNYRADIIVLLTNQNYPGLAGQANTIDPGAPNKFCIVEAQFLGEPRFTYAHELAHQFGCDHEPARASGLEEDCAHGHVLTIPGDPLAIIRPTVMAFSPALMPGDLGARIPHFSNPDINFAGQPTGIEDDRDNARMLRASMCATANIQPEAPVFSAFISGRGSLCEFDGSVSSNNTYYAVVTQPATGFPGVPPYSYQWEWTPDGDFTFGGTYLGDGASIAIASALNCPAFFVRLIVVSGDSEISIFTKKIRTNYCNSCNQEKSVSVSSGTKMASPYTIAPNPSTGTVWIATVAQPIRQVSLINAHGQMVRNWSAGSNANLSRLDVSGFPDGLYWLRLDNGQSVGIEKIVLQSSFTK